MHEPSGKLRVPGVPECRHGLKEGLPYEMEPQQVRAGLSDRLHGMFGEIGGTNQKKDVSRDTALRFKEAADLVAEEMDIGDRSTVSLMPRSDKRKARRKNVLRGSLPSTHPLRQGFVIHTGPASAKSSKPSSSTGRPIPSEITEPDFGREPTTEPDPGLEAVRWVYEKMHIDTEWSVWEERGFTWWGRHQAQRVWSEPVVDDDGIRICRVHARTDLVEEFDPSPENLAQINALNGHVVLSALVVDEDAGTVGYAASMWVHEQALDWAKRLWQTVVAIQAAHGNAQGELLAEAVGARAAATSHPTSGPREVGDEMLLVTEELVVPMGREPSRYAGEEMLGSLRMLENRRLALIPDSGEAGLQAFFPFRESESVFDVSGGHDHRWGGYNLCFPPGGYRFPFVVPKTLRLVLVPPSGYRAPSTVSTDTLQRLPNSPFAIVEPGSRGEAFILNPGPTFHIDLPVDPLETPLWISKSAGKDIVAIGDFLPYRLRVQNDTSLALNSVTVSDRLPLGFRYRSGSLRINRLSSPDPAISTDGRTLTMDIGNLADGTASVVQYVVEVAAGARPGTAVNRASAASSAGVGSNVATATVEVREDFFRSRGFIAGRVIAGACDGSGGGKDSGVQAVRIYLEDGTYAVTDEKGMFHFEGLKPGAHVVQLDLDSLPEKYEVVPCGENSRFAGRSFSQFVDIQGGTLWRTDFHLALRSKPKGKISFLLNGSAGEDGISHRIVLQGGAVPVRNLRLSVLLPEGMSYKMGSSRMDGVAWADPKVQGNILIYRLGEFKGQWTRRLDFEGTAKSGDETGDGLTKAFLQFDTPAGKNQRTPTGEYRLPSPGGTRVAGEKTTVETTGFAPGETWRAEVETVEKTRAFTDYNRTWIESAEPGREWLWPGPDFMPAIPSMKFAFKHHPKDTLKLLVNGSEIDPLYFEGMLKNKKGTVGASFWIGVGLKEGDNTVELILTSPQGEQTGHLSRVIRFPGPPANAELVKEQSNLIADGVHSPVIVVRLTDEAGYPAREGMTGYFSVAPPHAAQMELEALQERPLSGLDREALRYAVGKNGITAIQLQPTSRSGEAVVKISLARGKKGGTPPLANLGGERLDPRRPCRRNRGIQYRDGSCRKRPGGRPG